MAVVESAWAPGPWTAKSRDRDTWQGDIVWTVETDSPTPLCIADLYGEDFSAQVNAANARLVAKAPELVEALEAWLAWVAEEPGSEFPEHDTRTLLAELKGVTA